MGVFLLDSLRTEKKKKTPNKHRSVDRDELTVEQTEYTKKKLSLRDVENKDGKRAEMLRLCLGWT